MLIENDGVLDEGKETANGNDSGGGGVEETAGESGCGGKKEKASHRADRRPRTQRWIHSYGVY